MPLLDDLRGYQEDLAGVAEATAALDRLRDDARKDRNEIEQEPSSLGPVEAQKLSPAAIEELEGEVRVGTLTVDRRRQTVDEVRSFLGDLRQRQEERLLRLSAAERDAAAAAGTRQAPLFGERRQVAQQRRELAAERLQLAMTDLDLQYEVLANGEKLLASRSSRLSMVRLAAGVSAEELDRRRQRVEQLRLEVAGRATDFQGQLTRIDESLQSVRQRLQEAEQSPPATQPNAAEGKAQAQSESARKQLADETIAELRGQIEALEAAKALVRESSHLDEFLLALQTEELEHQEAFNRLLVVIRARTADVSQIEQGLARFRERLAAIRAEAKALQITSTRLRQDTQLNSEQLRQTAGRLSAAMEAETIGGGNTTHPRVDPLQALLSHQQAVSEALDSRRNLVDEAAGAANDQLKRYQDSVRLLESYVAGALRVNLNTLTQFSEWMETSTAYLGKGVEQLPARWVEFRLSMQDPTRRSRALRIGLWLALVAGGAMLLDLLCQTLLRRPRAQPVSFQRAALAYTLRQIHRPLELCGFLLAGWALVPEVRAVFAALALVALIWLVRRAGHTAIQLLFGSQALGPSVGLASGHVAWMRRWSRWLLILWPVVLAGYVAALWFGAPVHVRLILGLLSLVTTLGFLLALLVHGRSGVVRVITLASTRDKPSLPVLIYNRLLHVAYLLALVEVLVIVGLWGAGYNDVARWLALCSLSTVAILGTTAIVVRGLHLWFRRAISGNPFWSEIGSLLLHLLEALIVIAAMLSILVVWGVELGPLWQRIRIELDREVFQTAEGHSVTVLTLVWVVLILVASIWLSRRTRELLHSRVFPYLSIDRGQQLSLSLVMHYSLLLLAGMIGLNMLGINMTTLRVLLGAIGLGVGFGLQTIVNNFVSGIILLFERNIRPDDVVDFGGKRVRVEEIRARCTVVTDRDNKVWLVPNVRFMNDTITNWTQNGQMVRGQIEFTVAGNTDLQRLKHVVEDWAHSNGDLLPNPNTHCRLLEIERGLFRMALYYFTDQNWRFGYHRSKVSYDLIELLRREGFELPPPPSNVFMPNIEREGLGTRVLPAPDGPGRP